jgi:hypothetical protein
MAARNFLQIPLTGISGAGRLVKVSPADFPALSRYNWYYKDGYAITTMYDKEVRMHRFILNETREDYVVDHIDGDRLNNTRENLRSFTLKQNANNRIDNRRVTAFGEQKTVAEWADDPRCQVKYDVLLGRLRKEVWPEYAILAPEGVKRLFNELADHIDDVPAPKKFSMPKNQKTA